MLRPTLLVVLMLVSAPALADAEAGKQKARFCLLCHKPDFASDTLPTLQGQQAQYLRNQLTAFREKRRNSPIMQTNAGALTEEDMRDLIDYFSSQPPLKVAFELDSARVAAGKAAAGNRGCAGCHQPDYSGKGEVPRLAGMDPAYSAKQIGAFTAGERAHPQIDPQSGISAADAAALGQYFAQVE